MKVFDAYDKAEIWDFTLMFQKLKATSVEEKEQKNLSVKTALERPSDQAYDKPK